MKRYLKKIKQKTKFELKQKIKKEKTIKMKRRWSNNGGFALRMLEESSSEVTSSSAGLVLGPGGLTMSPSPLDSPDYGELELWYDETAYNQHSVIASAVQGCAAVQTTIIPLPSMNNALNHTPRSTSANSISSGKFSMRLFVYCHFSKRIF